MPSVHEMIAQNPQQQMAALYLQQARITVASLYPLEVRYNRPYKSSIDAHGRGGYNTIYDIPASDGSNPVIITVGPGAQNTHVGSKMYTDVWDTAYNIAKDVRRNARSVPLADGASGPAVWICEENKPTEEECKHNLQGQVIWARRRIIQARDWHIKGQTGLITELDRVLGRWLRIDPKAHGWMIQEEHTNTKACVFCFAQVDARAVICTACGTVIDPVGKKRIEMELEALAAEAAELEMQAAEFMIEDGKKKKR